MLRELNDIEMEEASGGFAFAGAAFSLGFYVISTQLAGEDLSLGGALLAAGTGFIGTGVVTSLGRLAGAQAVRISAGNQAAVVAGAGLAGQLTAFGAGFIGHATGGDGGGGSGFGGGTSYAGSSFGGSSFGGSSSGGSGGGEFTNCVATDDGVACQIAA